MFKKFLKLQNSYVYRKEKIYIYIFFVSYCLKTMPHDEMNQQRESSFERFSIIRETWHLDPLRRRLLRSHFFDALSSLISVKVESKLRRGETSRRIRTVRNVESFEEFFRFFSCLSSMFCDIIFIIIISLDY